MQFAFMEGKGTCNAIFNVRMVVERALEMQKDLFVCFIDCLEAFDTVRHVDLLAILRRLYVSRNDLRLTRKLYNEQTLAVGAENELTKWMNIKIGV